MDDRSSSVVNPSKHVQVYDEIEKENSVKSFKGSGKPISEANELLGAGTDSENINEQVEKEMNSEEVSTDNGVGDSVKVESDEVKRLSTVEDPPVELEAMDSLQDAGKALVPVVNSTEFVEDSEAAADAEEINVQETSLIIAQSQSTGEVVHRFSENNNAKVEIMGADAVDQIKQEALASAMEKLVERVCQELATATQSLKLQMKICKYLFLLIALLALFLLIALLAFILILGLFILKSQSCVEFVPT